MKNALPTILFLATATMAAAVEVPQGWIYTPEQLPLTPDDSAWKPLFQDVTLDSLMTLASESNYDLKEAAVRRQIAANAIHQARSAYWPQLSLSAGYTNEREHSVTSNQFDLGAQMNWEIDIFGRVNAAVKEKKAAYRASAAEEKGVKLSMASEMANYYVNYRLIQQHIELIERHIESQQKIVKITEARHDAGLVSKLDVTQAKTVLYSTEAALPALRSELRSTLTAIGALIGTYPDSIPVNLSGVKALPQAEFPPLGVPADLLRRRPDIIAAEAQLAASAAAIGIAKKDFLPTLSIIGEVGTTASRPGELFSNGSLSYSIAPTLSWTAFDGLSRRYGLEQARLEMENSLNSYNLTVINAVGEVDNAYAAYLSAEETAHLDKQLLEQAEESLLLSLDLYKQGLTEFTNVVNAQVSLLNADIDYLTTLGNSLTATINLYKALGGPVNL